MSKKVERKYGGPFTGFVSAFERHLAGPGAMTSDSYGWGIDPNVGAFYRRGGTTNKYGATTFDSYSGNASDGVRAGLLELGYINKGGVAIGVNSVDVRLRAVQAFGFESPSTQVAGGERQSPEVLGALYADERAADGAYGQFWWRWRRSDGTVTGEKNEVIAKRMQDTVSGAPNGTTLVQCDATIGYPRYLKPYAGLGSDTASQSKGSNVEMPGRLTTTLERAQMAGGSRRAAVMNGWVGFGSYRSYPHKWNRNKAGAAGVYTDLQYELVHPMGHVPPMWSPDISLGPTGQDGTWGKGDMFFLAVIFVKKDGSKSAPTQLRPATKRMPAVYGGGKRTTTGGLGLVGVDLAGGPTIWPDISTAGNHHTYITLTNVPIGPPDTDHRLVVRSLKVNGNAVGALPDIENLGICAIMENNTETSVILENGLDSELVFDDNLVRFDQTLAPRAKYLFPCDGRMLALYTRPNPIAMFLCPKLVGAAAESGAAAPYTPDHDNVLSYWDYASGTWPGNIEGGKSLFRFYFEITATALILYKKSGTSTEQPTRTTTFTLANYTSLQDLVDAINADGMGVAVGTTQAAYGAAGATSAGNWAACVAPGADPSAPVTGANACLRPTSTASGVTNLGAYADAFLYSSNGVAAWNTLKANTQRAFGNCWPGVAMFKESWLAKFSEQKRGVHYTGAGSAHPHNCIDSWYVGNIANYREAPESAGYIMGGGALLDGAVACYSKGIYLFRNIKGGKTGEDADYRLEAVNEARGCISPASIVEGNGWVGYLTSDGYVIFDGQTETMISGAVYNPATKVGEWANEIAQCEAATALDNDSYGCFAWLAGTKLIVSYRTSTRDIDNATAGTAAAAVRDNYPDREMEYDFSPGVAANKADAMVNPETGAPWPWSTPLPRRYSVGCRIAGSDGKHTYALRDKFTANSGSVTAFFGRVDEIDTGTIDAAESVSLTDAYRQPGAAVVWSPTASYQQVGDNGSGVGAVTFQDARSIAFSKAGHVVTTPDETGFLGVVAGMVLHVAGAPTSPWFVTSVDSQYQVQVDDNTTVSGTLVIPAQVPLTTTYGTSFITNANTTASNILHFAAVPGVVAGQLAYSTAFSGVRNVTLVAGGNVTVDGGPITLVSPVTVWFGASAFGAIYTFTGTSIRPVGFLQHDVVDEKRMLRATEIGARYLKFDRGLRLAYTRARNASRTDDTYWRELTLPAANTGDTFRTWAQPMPLNARGPAAAVELRVKDMGIGAAAKLWSASISAKILDLPVT